MSDLILTHRGVVYPWQCDHMGHLNVMWYVVVLAAAGQLGMVVDKYSCLYGWPLFLARQRSNAGLHRLYALCQCRVNSLQQRQIGIGTRLFHGLT